MVAMERSKESSLVDVIIKLAGAGCCNTNYRRVRDITAKEAGGSKATDGWSPAPLFTYLTTVVSLDHRPFEAQLARDDGERR